MSADRLLDFLDAAMVRGGRKAVTKSGVRYQASVSETNAGLAAPALAAPKRAHLRLRRP